MHPPPVGRRPVALPLPERLFRAHLVKGHGVHPGGADDAHRLIPAVQDHAVLPGLGQGFALQLVQRPRAGGGGLDPVPGEPGQLIRLGPVGPGLVLVPGVRIDGPVRRPKVPVGHGFTSKKENAPANVRGWADAHGTTPVSSWRGHSSALNARHTPRSSRGCSGVACPAARARACTVPSRLGAAGRTWLRHCLIILSHFSRLSTGK